MLCSFKCSACSYYWNVFYINSSFMYPTKGYLICSLMVSYSSIFVLIFSVVISSIELFSKSSILWHNLLNLIDLDEKYITRSFYLTLPTNDKINDVATFNIMFAIRIFSKFSLLSITMIEFVSINENWKKLFILE